MAACNDWRNGNPLGKFEHSEITRSRSPYGCVVEMEHRETTVDWNDAEKIVKVGRLRVPYLSHHSWVGNWCWDEWTVSEESAAKIINYLRDKRSAHYIGGESVVCDKIESKAAVEAGDLADEEAENPSLADA